jgi:nicotinate-nucleotide adenylyltransferase
MSKGLRIGIYAGAFDPVHAGHVAFALQATYAAKLDQVVFLPERRPRNKPGVEHYAHRVAMLKTALAPHPDLAVMEVVERHFTVRRTLNTLQQAFRQADFIFLMGSDAVLTIPQWPHYDQFLKASELVVGVRSTHQRHEVERAVSDWVTAPRELTIFDSFAPHVSSSRIRQALRANQSTEGLLTSVHRYARREWLYVSPSYSVV